MFVWTRNCFMTSLPTSVELPGFDMTSNHIGLKSSCFLPVSVWNHHQSFKRTMPRSADPWVTQQGPRAYLKGCIRGHHLSISHEGSQKKNSDVRMSTSCFYWGETASSFWLIHVYKWFYVFCGCNYISSLLFLRGTVEKAFPICILRLRPDGLPPPLFQEWFSPPIRIKFQHLQQHWKDWISISSTKSRHTLA